jgi:hypothetical protein
MDFYIASQLNSSSSRLIYLVIRYIDPEQLQIKNRVEINETFQIDEKNRPPTEGEIELCRIQLAGDNIRLSIPSNSFHPTENTLDLRYRQQAQSKPLSLIKIGIFQGDATQEFRGLSRLLSSIKGLYPALQGDRDIKVISPINSVDSHSRFDGDVIYLTEQRSQQISTDEFNLLETHRKKGGLIWIPIPIEKTKIEELQILEDQLAQEIKRIETMKSTTNFSSNKSKTKSAHLLKIQQMLETELKETQKEISKEIQHMMLNVRSFARRLGIQLESWEELSFDHPLKNEPFLFQRLPILRQQSLQLFYGDGLIVTIGSFIEIFDPSYEQNLPRETLRTFQEFAINILYFAYRKKQIQPIEKTNTTSIKP